MTTSSDLPQVVRVLAVDDNADDLKLLEDGFANCGTPVHLLTATTAPMALAEFMQCSRDEQPNVAVIDVNMPVISGLELAREMLRYDVVTLLMSSHVDEERTACARSVGVSKLLVKPSDYAGYIDLAKHIVQAARGS